MRADAQSTEQLRSGVVDQRRAVRIGQGASGLGCSVGVRGSHSLAGPAYLGNSTPDR